MKDEWYTPPHVLEAARASLGGIRWDLASCEAAQQTVKAERYFSKSHSFLIHSFTEVWQDGFWCNPPFSITGEFVNEIVRYSPKRGIVLTNANTSSKWWHILANDADCILLTLGRLAFIDNATGEPERGNPKGQSLFFWGCSPEPFQGMGTIIKTK